MQCQQRQWYFFLHRNCNSSSSYWMSNIMCKQIPCALWQRFWKAEFMCSELLTIEDTLTSFCDFRYSSLLDAQLYMYTLVNIYKMMMYECTIQLRLLTMVCSCCLIIYWLNCLAWENIKRSQSIVANILPLLPCCVRIAEDDTTTHSWTVAFLCYCFILVMFLLNIFWLITYVDCDSRYNFFFFF